MSSYVLSIARLVQLSYMLAVASHLRLAHLCHLSGLQELRWLPMTSVAIPYPRFLTTFASLIFAAIGKIPLPSDEDVIRLPAESTDGVPHAFDVAGEPSELLGTVSHHKHVADACDASHVDRRGLLVCSELCPSAVYILPWVSRSRFVSCSSCSCFACVAAVIC